MKPWTKVDVSIPNNLLEERLVEFLKQWEDPSTVQYKSFDDTNAIFYKQNADAVWAAERCASDSAGVAERWKWGTYNLTGTN